MWNIQAIFLIAFHALVAWLLVEIFVNNAHRLSRRQFILCHYVSVVVACASTFFVCFTFFVSLPVFAVSAVAMLCIALIELIVFGYLYTADRWFLNYVDWIFPMFLAWSTIYAVGKIVG